MATRDEVASFPARLKTSARNSLVADARRPALVISALFALLALAVLLASRFGTVEIGWQQIVGIVLKRVVGLDLGIRWSAADESIIWQLRLPRVLGAAIVGAGLAGAGVIFQGLLRNPMADPYLLGTSGGAALAATIGFLIPIQFGLFNYALGARRRVSGRIGRSAPCL